MLRKSKNQIESGPRCKDQMVISPQIKNNNNNNRMPISKKKKKTTTTTTELGTLSHNFQTNLDIFSLVCKNVV